MQTASGSCMWNESYPQKLFVRKVHPGSLFVRYNCSLMQCRQATTSIMTKTPACWVSGMHGIIRLLKHVKPHSILHSTLCRDDVDAKCADLEAAIMTPRSIYDLYSHRQRYLILLMISFVALLLPFSNVIYLPALPMITESLHTTPLLVTATISVYLVRPGATSRCAFSQRWCVSSSQVQVQILLSNRHSWSQNTRQRAYTVSNFAV